ncbi:MAG: site-specific integrase [Porphyromonadaceae bacterium]|nr:site-specific integrase [Porphyromonadaceae bacterium]
MSRKGIIKLRKREMATGNISLYLDIYLDGRRKYEYLKLYLVPERTKADREANKQTMILAEAILSKRTLELHNGRYGFEDAYKLDTNFLEYYRAMCEKRRGNKESIGNWGNWYSALMHLEEYCDEHTTFREITPEWVYGFRDFLENTYIRRDKRKTIRTIVDRKKLSQSSKVSYFNKLKACLNQAMKDRIIYQNPSDGIEGFKPEEIERVYLTLEEVKAMSRAECAYPALKRAFLFSCLTGLRKSDIEKMRWSEVSTQGEYTRIIFKQKKTGGQEYLDISPQAVLHMGDRGEPEDLVFTGFRYSSYMIAELRMWAVRAGISKRITFHSGRHTFAVLMLDLGADIYTVQKLLGHKEIHTTQIYAKVLDKKKQEAVMMIPDINIL